MSLGTVLVTGASGFSARHLAERLRATGVERIVGVSRAPRTLRGSEPGTLWDHWRVVDPTDAVAVRALVRAERPDHVFHLAGTPVGSEAEVIAACVGSTQSLLNAIREEAPECGTLLVGSAAEYGHVPEAELPVRESREAAPVSAYGRAKLAATTAAVQFAAGGGKVVVARPFNLIGAGVPASLVVGALIEQLVDVVDNHATDLLVGRTDTQRDFLAIEDAIHGYIRLMQNSCWGSVVNLCSGTPTSIRMIVEWLVAIADRPVAVRTDPALVRIDDVRVNYGSWELAHSLIGFTPRIPLIEALQSAWYAAVARRSGQNPAYIRRGGYT